jgi:hypothetical protein
MANRNGWERDLPGRYFQAVELENGTYAIGVIRNWGMDVNSWQGAFMIKPNLADAVEWIHICLSYINDDAWNVDITEYFDTFQEAQDVFTGYLMMALDGELVS